MTDNQPTQPESDAHADQLVLTGERTVPGIDAENYWFRRHEVAYEYILDRCEGLDVLEAGSGEGYGAAMIATRAKTVTCVDYDEQAAAHTRRRYPELIVHQGNLIDLPLADGSIDVVVNFQVIEHLWDQSAFVAECHRVLRPGGVLLMSTPNRITFSPGRDTPLNPFHTRELNAAEMTELLTVVPGAGSEASGPNSPDSGGFEVQQMLGVFHGAALAALDEKWGGSIIDAQIERALAGTPWPDELTADVAAVSTADFDILASDVADIDASLDLFAVAVRR